MANQKYAEFIEISPNFESVIDIDADTRNKNLWREYIVGEDMETMMEALCQSLNHEAPDSRRSFWMEGTYGTGKSYAAIMIKHLLEESYDVVDSFLAKSSRLSKYRNRFLNCRAKEKGDYLVSWQTACNDVKNGTELLMKIEDLVRKALKAKFGDKADYGDASLQDAVIAQLNSRALNWDHLLQTSVLSDHYDSVDALQKSLQAGDLFALQQTAAVLRENHFAMMDSMDTFKAWIASVIKNNDLAKSGIFILWDEFTEYITHSDDHTILQELSEFCKEQPFFMLLVVHKTTEMTERLGEKKYQRIVDRFHHVEFHVSQGAAFDLIAGSIQIRNGMGEHWHAARKRVLKSIQPFLPDMIGLDDRISEQLKDFCPMHPMTVKLLAQVAEHYAASQRTMFRFMKDQSDATLGFVGYIQKEGPDAEACWLTPEWLWDYFFTRGSDFSDKDTKAATYIRHYRESRPSVESDENAHRVFKTAMLLLAMMDSAKGFYIGKKAKDGIAATTKCLKLCLAGILSEKKIDDYLQTMVDAKTIVLSEDANHDMRLQLPYRGTGDTDFQAKFTANDKLYSRYKMFAKDGVFAQAFEEQAWDQNDAARNRMKIAVCCAETASIKNRLDEVIKELEKCPYKLGLLLVTVASDAQASSVQAALQQKAADTNEPRLIIALVKTPLTEENRKKWLTAITNQEMAAENGRTGEENRCRIEAKTIVMSFVSSAKDAGKIIAYNKDRVLGADIYGMANLRKVIQSSVQQEIFPYAPERIIITTTAYKPCNDGAATAGVQRTTKNSQPKNVLKELQDAGLLDRTKIEEIAATTESDNEKARCVAELADLVKNEMESGHRVMLDNLWKKLQQPPFGYYNTIVCGVLLGFVFSCYKNSKYTWTDPVQSSHLLDEATIAKMVMQMCTGKMTNDYLAAGSLTWQQFSEYLAKIFDLSEGALATEKAGCHNVREAIQGLGTPFWVIKYLPASTWQNEEQRDIAPAIVEHIQTFVAENGKDEGKVKDAMEAVLQLFEKRGKLRMALSKAFRDKATMTGAFRTFLFEASPELKEVVTRLAIQPQELSDRLHLAMQASVYTWTEEQVREKIAGITEQYKYVEAIGKALKKVYHSTEDAKKDLSNSLRHLRLPVAVIEKLHKPWFPALQVLQAVVDQDVSHMDDKKRQAAIGALTQYGELAWECVENGKPVLEDVLNSRHIEYTQTELDAIYEGLSEVSYNSSQTFFEKELQAQLSKIRSAKNKATLLSTWHTITGEDSIKTWCNTHHVPLLWLVSEDLKKPLMTLLEVQNGNAATDTAVTGAIAALKEMDPSLLTDPARIEKAFSDLFEATYVTMLNEDREAIIREAKLKLGNDMSAWNIGAFNTLQGILKRRLQEKAKKEKLAGTKNDVRTMQDSLLRDRVTAFLDAHPEFCDDFSK